MENCAPGMASRKNTRRRKRRSGSMRGGKRTHSVQYRREVSLLVSKGELQAARQRGSKAEKKEQDQARVASPSDGLETETGPSKGGGARGTAWTVGLETAANEMSIQGALVAYSFMWRAGACVLWACGGADSRGGLLAESSRSGGQGQTGTKLSGSQSKTKSARSLVRPCVRRQPVASYSVGQTRRQPPQTVADKRDIHPVHTFACERPSHGTDT
ncbi:hypothetical protein BJ875DRAFT_436802 [Amylocarpus encephaloides]|uniref:Uncharacterized protein n=1 Tax=Amylocarpus encephaloides TaxID=45428 RepID=A0A9P7YT45_9HELO|nr:hypothetical protein BJ875DRAFT_436802 [Amylocarpus encephaloides]